MHVVGVRGRIHLSILSGVNERAEILVLVSAVAAVVPSCRCLRDMASCPALTLAKR